MDKQLNIVEVVSCHVDLRRQGKELTGRCPLHKEKTPSFTVNEERGVFYCHGCHEGGDVITFIQKIVGLDFKGAIAYLGITEETRLTRAKIKKREELGK